MTPQDSPRHLSASDHPSPALRTVSVAEMQQLDDTAITIFKIPRLLLMEHAGLALARGVARLAERLSKTGHGTPSVVVCCGTGFNGGDGMAAARHLQAWGYRLRVAVTGRLDRLYQEPATYAAILRQLGLTLLEIDSAEASEPLNRWLADGQLIIDALLGIGLSGPVRAPAAQIIDRMNDSGKPIVSADIPSGLDGDTGRPHGAAVRAAMTVAFGLVKHGCVVADGPAYTGELVVDPITLPRAILEPAR